MLQRKLESKRKLDSSLLLDLELEWNFNAPFLSVLCQDVTLRRQLARTFDPMPFVCFSFRVDAIVIRGGASAAVSVAGFMIMVKVRFRDKS
jgi:hypothetical protein